MAHWVTRTSWSSSISTGGRVQTVGQSTGWMTRCMQQRWEACAVRLWAHVSPTATHPVSLWRLPMAAHWLFVRWVHDWPTSGSTIGHCWVTFWWPTVGPQVKLPLVSQHGPKGQNSGGPMEKSSVGPPMHCYLGVACILMPRPFQIKMDPYIKDVQ